MSARDDAAEALAAEQARLANAVAHLERSNDELRAALVDAPGDVDYEEALVENARVVANYRARIAELAQLLGE